MTAMVRALVIAAVELGAAWALVRREVAGSLSSTEALGLGLPRGAWKALAASPVLGVLVWIVGSALTRAVPSTSVSSIETFVAAPSGTLVVASIALFVPVAEEVFFRGFVYGVVERARGANLAMVASVVLFALAHLPQQWGAWGPFLSVAFTGVVLTVLRRAAGGVLLPALVHLAHNAWIAFLSV